MNTRVVTHETGLVVRVRAFLTALVLSAFVLLWSSVEWSSVQGGCPRRGLPTFSYRSICICASDRVGMRHGKDDVYFPWVTIVGKYF